MNDLPPDAVAPTYVGGMDVEGGHGLSLAASARRSQRTTRAPASLLLPLPGQRNRRQCRRWRRQWSSAPAHATPTTSKVCSVHISPPQNCAYSITLVVCRVPPSDKFNFLFLDVLYCLFPRILVTFIVFRMNTGSCNKFFRLVLQHVATSHILRM